MPRIADYLMHRACGVRFYLIRRRVRFLLLLLGLLYLLSCRFNCLIASGAPHGSFWDGLAVRLFLNVLSPDSLFLFLLHISRAQVSCS